MLAKPQKSEPNTILITDDDFEDTIIELTRFIKKFGPIAQVTTIWSDDLPGCAMLVSDQTMLYQQAKQLAQDIINSY